MNILIIGSKGFIGSHCLDYFRQAGHNVYGCDVVVDYADKNYFLIDPTNADYKEIFEENDFQVCINCSGAASVSDSIHHPRRDFELNTLNVFRMLDAIRLSGQGCKFIQLSSAAVYGNPSVLPVKESSTLNPVSPYGWHKYYSELVCHEFASLYKINMIILRPFSVYGPGLKKQLFWDLYQKSLGKSEINLFGAGTETRDFIFIDDILQAIELAINKAAFHGECINIANGQQVTIKTAADIFYNALGWKGTTRFMGETRKGDPLNWEADISKLKDFGYSAKFSLQSGLQSYAAWLKEPV